MGCGVGSELRLGFKMKMNPHPMLPLFMSCLCFLLLPLQNFFLITPPKFYLLSMLSQLQATISSKRKEHTHSMMQLINITTSEAGAIRMVRDSIESLAHCMAIVTDKINTSQALTHEIKGLLVTPEQKEEILKLEAVYRSCAPAVREIKNLLLRLRVNVSNSEFQYAFDYLMALLWKLFHPVNKVCAVCAS